MPKYNANPSNSPLTLRLGRSWRRSKSNGSFKATMKRRYCSGLCSNRAATQVRVTVRPKCKPAILDAGKKEVDSGEREADSGGVKKENPRRIMVVLDGSRESRSALQWALTHALHPIDTLILCFCKKLPEARSQYEDDGKEDDLVQAMKDLCHARKPQVQVETSLVEEKEKGPGIVEAAKKQEASLLILGQKKRCFTWGLLMNRAGDSKVGDALIDYCIQNAHCMAIAVRKREGNMGGYLLTTKKLKDFWLLA